MSLLFAKIIQAGVCGYFGLDRSELIGRRRYGSLIDARHLAMYLCRQRLRMSFPALGEVFERDHSTVLDACKRLAGRLDTEPQLRKHLEALHLVIDQAARKDGL